MLKLKRRKVAHSQISEQIRISSELHKELRDGDQGSSSYEDNRCVLSQSPRGLKVLMENNPVIVFPHRQI